MRIAVLGMLAACGHHSTTSELAKTGAPALHAIDPVQLEANTKYLSSDELAGRAPGSEGGAKAEQYVADQFAKLGLQPAGEGGTYFQTVPLREAILDAARSSLVVHAKAGDVELVHGKDAVLVADPHSADVAIDAPLVFVGYGISTAGYDDLAGLDLHGAIAVVFGGAPRSLAGKPLDASLHAVLADVKKRSVDLRAHGASAMLVIYDPARAQRMSFAKYVTKVFASSMAWLDHGEVGSLPVLPMTALSDTALDRVLGDGKTHALWEKLDRGERVQVDLAATASLRVRAQLRDVTARNVAALLPGSDPALAAETVVYSAHLDHLGLGPPVDGDSIYNGALDDAIGVAGIIEMARGFVALPQHPKRSLLFLAVTAEEKGLLGSDYFAAHPTIPLARIVADINIDGLSPLYEEYDMLPLGAEHSTLAAHAEAAAHATGYVLSPDPDPDQVFFIRSDQYSFVERGVPSVFPNAGWRDANGDTAAYKAISDKWAAEHYHQPSDVWRPEYNAAWAAKEAGFDVLFGLSVANAPERPRWNPGDAFANTASQEPTAGVTGR
ncbi:MAG: M28 family peptidase [Acidobacteriota bacterium]